MTAGNRATKYENLYKALKKHFKPSPEVGERSVLEHLIYACCLEDARHEQADEAFAKLQQTYFDWNEVRVTTVVELSDALASLPFANAAAARIKQCLQSLFESRYQYDLDDMKKANLGKAVEELEAWKGISPFVVSYVSQHALGGHSIPLGVLTLDAFLQCDLVTPAEADKKTAPGLERAIAKNKGIEFASLLHQFANELHAHPKNAVVTAILKEMGTTYKPKPKVEAKPEPPRKKIAPPVSEPGPKAPTKTDTKAETPKAESKAETLKADGKKGGAEPTKKTEKKGAEPIAPKKVAPAKPEATKSDVAKKPTTKAEDAKTKAKTSKPATAAPSKGKADDKTKENTPDKPHSKKAAPPAKPSKPTSASSITKKKPK